MSSTGYNPRPERSRAARYFVPRSHRLFAVFDNRATADTAVAELRSSPVSKDDTWFFEGDEGARELDPGAVGGPVRAFSWLFSDNIEHLRGMSRSVADGQVVVAVFAKNLQAADGAARVLRGHGGQWFAYTAHGNFVPVTF